MQAPPGRALLVVSAGLLAGAVPEIVWANIPSVLTEVASRYGLGAAGASLPVLAFAAGSVLSAPLAGRCVDGRGYHVAIRLGLVLSPLAAVLRPGAPFWLLTLAQAIAGASFSLITAATMPLIVDWLEPRHVPVATGLAVTCLLAGLGASLAATPFLAGALGLTGMFTAVAVCTVALSALCLPLIRRARAGTLPVQGGASLWSLWRDRTLCLLFGMSFLLGGAASAVSTVLEPIWVARGLSMASAGSANALLMVGGAAGSFALPWLLTRGVSARTVLLGCSLAVLLLTWPLLMAADAGTGKGVALLAGVCWIGNIPVMLTMLEQAAGATRAGSATSLFWATNNLGSIGVVWTVSAIADASSWRDAALATLALLALNQAVTFGLPRRRPG